MSTATHPTTGQALLAAILAAPEDDAPRLVFADWLDEHGEGERGEFVRVQVELARMDGPDPDCCTVGRTGRHATTQGLVECPECWPKRAALRQREHQLWTAESVRLMDWCNTVGLDFQKDWPFVVRRGFVGRVECPLAVLFGGPCGRCEGRGTVCLTCRTGVDHGSEPCPHCKGEKVTPGLAAALFAAQPVTEVRLTDREPAEHVRSIDTRTHPHHRPFWFVGPQMGINDRERHWIPPDIGRLIDGDTTPGGPNAVYFDSAEAAHAALSGAACRLGRHRRR